MVRHTLQERPWDHNKLLWRRWDTALVRKWQRLQQGNSCLWHSLELCSGIGCWPRPSLAKVLETFGEDVKLVGDMGESMVRGFQDGPVKVAATLKHYMDTAFLGAGKTELQRTSPSAS